MTVLLLHGDREYLCAPGEELQTDLGVLTVPETVEPGQILETHLGEEFTVRRLRSPDLFAHMNRTGAPMMPKDIGQIVGYTGVQSDDRILDAGTGTGVLAAYLGRMGANVVTYERKEAFAEVARSNMEMAAVSDVVEVRTGDVADHLDELGTFDLVTLDTGDAPEIAAHAPNLLVSGGFLAVYTPFVESARDVSDVAHEAGLKDVETLETIQRRMDFDKRGSRPTTAGVGHTGYLTFARLR